jgi:transposase
MQTRYVGLDVHREVLQACILDAEGRRLERHRLDLTRPNLEAFVRERLRPHDRVVLEATTNTWAVVELIEPHVAEVVVGNPLRTRAIAEAKIKTDKVDAEVLAQLLRCDYLPRVWQPDAATRRLRELSAHRAGLVADQTRLKNRIHSMLAQRLTRAPWVVLFSKQGRDWLNQLPLGESDRLMLAGHLRRLDQLEAELTQLEKHLAEVSYPCQEVRLLMTIPGMGPAAAQGLWAALGDWRRFRDGDHAASYLGLVPSTRQSAYVCRHGPITKAGNPHARWLLTQAAQHLALHPGPLGVFFRRLARRKNRNVAVVATARKLVGIAWLMLKHGEPYRYSQPESTRTKLAAFRVTATGQRRKKGPLLERPQRREPGERVHCTAGLNGVYASEGLPTATAPDNLPAGERCALEAMGIAALPQQVQTLRRRTSRRPPSSPLNATGEPVA